MSISKRKRSIYVTSLIATVFALVLTIFFFRKQKVRLYSPGESVKGVTSELYKPVPKNHPDVVFTDITKRAGINFTHFYGQRSTQLPEDMGSGAAWIDYDQDGFDDLLVVNEAGALRRVRGVPRPAKSLGRASDPPAGARRCRGQNRYWRQRTCRVGIVCSAWREGERAADGFGVGGDE